MTDDFDIDDVRRRLEETDGRTFWRSLEEAADTEQFQEYIKDEFPREASTWSPDLDRREFLKLSAASMALAGAAGCNPNERDDLIPYVTKPEEVVPGNPLFFASAFPIAGFGQGILAESHTGRPTKLEGNPDHPASRGNTTAHGQALVLSLYDPDRSQVPYHGGEPGGWSEVRSQLATLRQRLEVTDGEGLHLLTGRVTSPTMAHQLQQLMDQYPKAEWTSWEPVGARRALEGARRAFGRPVQIRPRLERAQTIAAFDADFLGIGPGQLFRARQFARTRKVRAGAAEGEMSRLYTVESAPTLTGAKADHVQSVAPRDVERALRGVAERLDIDGVAPETDPAVPTNWLDALADDLLDQTEQSAVLVGEAQPPRVHALGHLINQRLDNLGRTLELTEPVAVRPDDDTTLAELGDRIEQGRVDRLFILGQNPVYTAPADVPFGDLVEQVDLAVHFGMYRNETAAACDWHLPRSHPLEAWSDIRATDGTATVFQPIIEPLYSTRTVHELLAELVGDVGATGREIVRHYWESRWQSHRPGESFETGWRRALEQGVVPGTDARPITPSIPEGFTPEAPPSPDEETDEETYQIVFRPDPSVWDGRFANNGWLQELPKPLNSLTWDNAALISPQTAEQLGVSDEDVVELTHAGTTIRAPVMVVPGHPNETVTCRLGYGRRTGGRIAEGVGFDAYKLRPSDALWSSGDLEVEPTGTQAPLASVQDHHVMEGRDLVKAETYLDVVTSEHHEAGHEQESLHPEWDYDDYAWAMVIDQTLCIGCKACVTACQAENNIPIVGKRQVRRGREMFWIRVDSYYAGDVDNPDRFFQPVPCMHCEKAPCEVVCPVAATTHSDDGVNEMTYNRCIGTRYCSNNCPYKVRRFNFLDYQDTSETVAELQHNPDVTVRSRGVMEKCTYCIQRINDARQAAKSEDREIRTDEVVTACQAACPTDAIVFGDKNNPDSRVTERKHQPHEYSLLEELNTRPRTTYLKAIENVNPALASDGARPEVLGDEGEGGG